MSGPQPPVTRPTQRLCPPGEALRSTRPRAKTGDGDAGGGAGGGNSGGECSVGWFVPPSLSLLA